MEEEFVFAMDSVTTLAWQARPIKMLVYCC